jgi:hypothetical protein
MILAGILTYSEPRKCSLIIMQKRHKGPRPKTATTRQRANKGARRQTTDIGEKKENNQHDLQEGHRAGDREASSRDFQRVAKNQELDLVER